MSKARKLGLVVNPIAGMGGKVGLKGTDGNDILRRAIELRATPVSPPRAVEALRRVSLLRDPVELMTCSGAMGEIEVLECGMSPAMVCQTGSGKTTSADTVRAARAMTDARAEIILFAGGDGTARDVLDAVDGRVPVLGIPAGVKLHSAVFAISPRAAGDLAVKFLRGDPVELREAEVMDIDEQAFRENRVVARLYGYLRVPFERTMVQSGKAGSPGGEEATMSSIAADVVERMDPDALYIIGPGTTTRPIMDSLGLRKTLLGVDVVRNGKTVLEDANEPQLLELLKGSRAKIVVSVIGGQGFVFGRGSQQISHEVIRRVGKENLIVVATPAKLASLKGAPLLVDTGDDELDRMLDGYMNVVTGYGRRAVYRLKSA